MSLVTHLESKAAEFADRCTSCGRCVEACPVIPVVGLGDADAGELVRDLKSLTAGGPFSPQLRSWTEACNSSGQCNAVCPEQINVREWMTVGKLKLKTELPEQERSARSTQQFRRMAQAVHLLASMQVPSQLLREIMAPAKGRSSEVVFYYGCNVLRTPHIIFNVMDILDCIGTQYEVVGGTPHCCGVVQYAAGDLAAYERMAPRTYGAFEAMGAKQVVTWCPTCTLQFKETYHDYARPSFEVEHITGFLAARKEQIAAKVVRPVRRRAVLHEHGGMPGIVESVRELLALVPDLELVEVPQNKNFGYQCTRVAEHPEQQVEVHRTIAEAARAAGVDLIITIYHGCHRQLCALEGEYPYEVKNFTDVLAEALGREHCDTYKALKVGGDIYDAIREAEGFLQQNGVSVTGREQLLEEEVFGEPGITKRPIHLVRAAAEPARQP